MSRLRRLLHVLAGWLLGLWTTLGWVWISEGKAALGGGSALYGVEAGFTTLLSLFLLFWTLVHLVDFTVTGKESR